MEITKMERKELYTKKEVSEMLGYGQNYLSSKRMRALLPCMRDMENGRIFYKREVLKKFLESRKPRVGVKQVVLD